MKILKEFLILLSILILGEFISMFFKVPIPGSILGIIILFLLLHFKVITIQTIELLSKFILANLAFFFIPPSVKLIASFDLLKEEWFKIIFICLFTTILVMVVTGYTVQYIIRKDDKNGKYIK